MTCMFVACLDLKAPVMMTLTTKRDVSESTEVGHEEMVVRSSDHHSDGMVKVVSCVSPLVQVVTRCSGWLYDTVRSDDHQRMMQASHIHPLLVVSLAWP